MPSFDIVNEIDHQEVDNAINNTLKEIATRYDFRGSNTTVKLKKKEKRITIVTEDSMKIKAVKEMITGNFVKRKLSHKTLDFQEPEGTSHGGLKMNALLKEGIDRDNAKKIVKMIKDSGLKVQAQINDDKVKVTGKKIDDLQAVMAEVRGATLEIPVQFENMKS